MPAFTLPAGARKLPDNARYANRIQIHSDSSDKFYTIAYDRAAVAGSARAQHSFIGADRIAARGGRASTLIA
jgi:hypothetical protein